MTNSTQYTQKDVEIWLIDRVATYGNRPKEDISTTRPLAELGLDSVYALALCGEIEDSFQLEVDPTIAWDHPTIEALAEELVQRLNHD
ncbi:phosphopantetheine attachment domain protein [Rothia dentocariosa ATCC 17931]|uniref:Phosphopantetheine attachment domain protein n=1 Tax=Rothia dentocariosa (strain ATCC 17931 / CDC X599 / XDIA) TaxID=762948 RepID=E3H2P5_ROTDC|nr:MULTISPECIES: acyl carrier protein [Rothia]ADP40314.1 phosphopantetheine attachment domain protein [Rothia dentocariosa ATCC 17931]OFN45979.1 polyketide synthase [Rothia sp. HMSC071F11]